jgi:hypothetical protein
LTESASPQTPLTHAILVQGGKTNKASATAKALSFLLPRPNELAALQMSQQHHSPPDLLKQMRLAAIGIELDEFVATPADGKDAANRTAGKGMGCIVRVVRLRCRLATYPTNATIPLQYPRADAGPQWRSEIRHVPVRQ